MRAARELEVSNSDGSEQTRLLEALGAKLLRFDPKRPPDVTVLCGEALPADERRVVVEALLAVATDGVTRTIEHRALHVDQRELWLRTAMVREGDGGQVIAAALDISESRVNEKQWRELESWLVALGEALPFDFWICDRNGRCVLQNPASVKRLGNAVGMLVRELKLPPDRLEKFMASFASALAGETVRQELETVTDGVRRAVVQVVSPIRADDAIQGVLTVEMDVTELKQTEDRLLESLTELARTQDALVRRRQLAALGEMAASLAHEVRNPLGAISNVAALLRRLSTGNAELCGILDDETARMDLLVTELLQFAQSRPLVLMPASLGELAEDVCAQVLRAEGCADRITATFEIDPFVPPLLMDGELLALALGNLFRNAAQAIREVGTVRVVVERRSAEGVAWAQVSITDSGAGIPPELRPRFFEPFVSSRPTGSGSGLGLSIVRRAVEDHHGKLEVDSEPGRGTTVILRLPLSGTES